MKREEWTVDIDCRSELGDSRSIVVPWRSAEIDSRSENSDCCSDEIEKRQLTDFRSIGVLCRSI